MLLEEKSNVFFLLLFITSDVQFFFLFTVLLFCFILLPASLLLFLAQIIHLHIYTSKQQQPHFVTEQECTLF